jgi:chemotaxis signal transduction protein
MNATNHNPSPAPTTATTRELLVFAYGDVLFAVDAVAADTVIPWREPMPLPGAGQEFLGVVQDRGRVVTVIRHPAGSTPSERPQFARIIVCNTPRGHLGLPASSTRGMAHLPVPDKLRANEVFDSGAGPITYVQPEELVGRLVRGGPAQDRSGSAAVV